MRYICAKFVSITYPSLQILSKTQTDVFMIFGFLFNPLWKKIVIIPETVMILTWNLDQWLKLTRKTKLRQKKLTLTSCQKTVRQLSFFGFLAYLEHSGDRILDTKSAKVIFSVIVISCLRKHKTRTKKPLILLLWGKVLFWTKNAHCLQKNNDINKIKGV